jgi:hypothetical protein
MSTNALKISTWGGANKAKIRLFKKYEIQKTLTEISSDDDLPEFWRPKMLSFAGPYAILERMLVNHRAVTPTDITTIQTYEKMSQHHNGETILRTLLNTRKKHLSGMRIWPYNFYSFSKNYKLGGCSYPSTNTQAKWSKKPYKYFMDTIVKEPVNRFNILDLDLCGIFSQKNADSVENLFKHRVVDKRGVAFITHQKGRDVRGGKLFNVLHKYLKESPLIDFESIFEQGEKLTDTYIARYILIPLYYMCKANEYGYVLSLDRLIEYRDLNRESNLAVSMLQYFFSWVDADYVKDYDSLTRSCLETVVNEEYEFLSLM